MRFCIFFVHEVGIVGSNNLNTVFTRQLNQDRVHLFLSLIHLYVRSGLLCLMALNLNIIVLSEEVLEPFYCFFRFAEIITFCDSIEDFLRYLTTQTCGTTDDAFMPFLQ